MPLHSGNSRRVISENIAEMQAAGHSHAQSVAAALHNARKGSPMKSDGMGSENGMSPRKAMASGLAKGGNFGVEPYGETHGGMGPHPDHTAHTGMKPHMDDSERGAPPGINHTKGHHPAQAAPNHGPHHPGGYGDHMRGGKV